MVLECGPTTIVGVRIVRIVVVAIICPSVSAIRIVVIAASKNSIVGIVGLLICP